MNDGTIMAAAGTELSLSLRAGCEEINQWADTYRQKDVYSTRRDAMPWGPGLK